MDKNELLQASCRIALAGLLRHVSKFAERAKNSNNTTLEFLKKLARQNESANLTDIFSLANELAAGSNSAHTQETRQLVLFEQIHIEAKKDRPQQQTQYCYQPSPLSPQSIFPTGIKNYQADYPQLWTDFVQALQQIPESHQQNLALWLDHFDSCLQTYTHNIPSDFASDVSLYDHSKVAAALATALWAHQQAKPDRTDKKFLLIQADFFGIQNFIFVHGGGSTKKAAKLLRGRSFYVSLITECASLAVLDALNLPSTSQIINAAGKFLIVAPNTDDTKSKLKALQQTFNQWFLEQSYGQSGLGLAWQEACCDDFVNSKEHKFKTIMKSLHTKLERSKYQHFDLCGENPAQPIFSHYLDSFNNEFGVCQLNDKAPAANEDKISQLAQDQINIGSWLIKQQRLIISTDKINGLNALKIPLFGYVVHFVESEGLRGRFGKEAENNIRRLFDFSPANSKTLALWNGYARRNISGYVPYFKAEDEYHDEKYLKFLNDEDLDEVEINAPKLLNHLALEDVNLENDGHWYGIKALAVLKGDIDNLGAMFQNGLEQPTFSKMATLSRQVNNFFAVYVPYLCQSQYKNTYIVFAGGDDFFLLGSWHQLMDLANQLRKEFARYVVNEQIHFSAGLTVMKPKIPIYQLAEIAEEALEQSKQYPGKNAITCFKQTVSWKDFETLTTDRYQRLEELREQYGLSSGYVYGLLRLSNMAADNSRPENSLWRSQLFYRTYRTVANKKGMEKEAKKRACEILANDIGKLGIEDFKSAYQITLNAHLYTHRKQA